MRTGALGCCSPGTGFGISLCKSSWNSSQLHFFSLSSAHHSVSCALQTCWKSSAPSSRSLIKVFGSIGPTTTPGGHHKVDSDLLPDGLSATDHNSLHLWTNLACTLATWLCRDNSKCLTKDKHQLVSLFIKLVRQWHEQIGSGHREGRKIREIYSRTEDITVHYSRNIST